MGLHTQLQHEYLSKPKSFTKKSIPSLNESTLWRTEPIVLFCGIISVNAIDKRFSKKPIRFEISLGPRNYLGDWNQTFPNVSDEIKPVTNDKVYWYLDFRGKIPCINYQNHFPDFRRRFFNKNMIRKISDDLKKRLDDIEPLFQYERCRIPSGLIGKKLDEALNVLAEGCRNYIDVVGRVIGDQATNLDKEKIKLCLKEMEDIEKLAKTIYNFKTKKKSYRKAQKLYIRLSLLEDHPQDCWPDILIYMMCNGKKVAAQMIESEDVVFSMEKYEMGPLCGKIHSIHLNTPLKLKTLKNALIACKMDLFLWVGLKKEIEFCFNSLPEGFYYETTRNFSNLPRYLSLNTKINFQCRAHIYQGRFKFGADVTGLSDYYIRVILNEESVCTQIIKGKLNPLWDETVIIPFITVYGSGNYIKENPPTCIIEVVDYDDIRTSQYVGRIFVKPVVKLKSDPYTKPDFPPVLKWYEVIQENLSVGKVLLCIELLEISSGLALAPSPSKDKIITKIPDDIRPILSGYKTDILFWGVRHLKKLYGIPVTKPKIMIDFTVTTIESETATNKFPNFDPKTENLIVSLPIEQDYIPSLGIQLIENRAFGRSTYVANHITTIDRFLYYPLTREEREFSLSHHDTKSYDSMESQGI
nr:otoferlin-like isoform X1 [Onthophagus taurus]